MTTHKLINDLTSLKENYAPITANLADIAKGLIKKNQTHNDPKLAKHAQELVIITTQLLTNYSELQDILINLVQTEIDKYKTEINSEGRQPDGHGGFIQD